MPIITDVQVCQPIDAKSPPDWRTSIGQILVTIRTDAGLTGVGVGGGGLAGMHVINAVLKPLLVGQQSEEIDQLNQLMHRAVLPFGPEGIAMMAVSGIDLALWDLLGKQQDSPVASLLNDSVDLTQRIPTYQTIWHAEDAKTVSANSAVKLHLGRATGQDRACLVDGLIRQVETVRELIGPDRKLMVDAWMTWDLQTTLQFAERAAALDLEWIEEPLPLTDLPGYRELSQESPIPIAGGEHVFTAHNFERIIAESLYTIFQPDICWVGGLSEMIKIYELAAQAGRRVIPHRGGELWGLHAVAALDEQPLAESGRPWMSWVGGQPEIDNGTLQLPNSPGFGVTIADAAYSAPTTLHL